MRDSFQSRWPERGGGSTHRAAAVGAAHKPETRDIQASGRPGFSAKGTAVAESPPPVFSPLFSIPDCCMGQGREAEATVLSAAPLQEPSTRALHSASQQPGSRLDRRRNREFS